MSDTIIYGRHPVTEAIQSAKTFDKVLFQQGIKGEFEREVRTLCKRYNIPMQIVPKERLSHLSKGKNHQGIIGLMSAIKYQRLKNILHNWDDDTKAPLFLVVDGVTDVRNIGAIARSAELAGVDALVLSQKKTAPINAEAIKASAGALTKLPVCREKSISSVVDFLQLKDIQVLASDLKAIDKVYEMDFKTPTAIIVGSENRGVNPHLLEKVDETFIIPQVGASDSFNVSVATGIILYEVMRQRGA